MAVHSQLENSTGLKVDYDKSSIYRIGSLKTTNAKMYTNKKFHWTNDDIRVLGIDILSNTQNLNKVNYQKIIKKAKATIQDWSHRG